MKRSLTSWITLALLMLVVSSVSATEAVTLPDSDELVVETINERYPSGKMKCTRDVALDADFNYVNHGPFEMFDEKGNTIAKGEYKANQRDGSWLRIYSGKESSLFTMAPFNQFTAPYKSEATFQDGTLNGIWRITDAQERVCSEIQLEDGLRDGKCVYYFADGKVMREIDFTGGVIDGFDRTYDANGVMISEHEYIAGRLTTVHVETYVSTQKKTEMHLLYPALYVKTRDNWWDATLAAFDRQTGEPTRHGVQRTWHENGQPRSISNFVDGKPTGEYVFWFENGQKQMHGNYVAGNRDGQWSWWHQNGMKSIQGEYENGQATGLWVRWEADGKLAKLEKREPGNTTGEVTAEVDSEPATLHIEGNSSARLPAQGGEQR